MCPKPVLIFKTRNSLHGYSDTQLDSFLLLNIFVFFYSLKIKTKINLFHGVPRSSFGCVSPKGTSGGAVVLTTNKGSIGVRRLDNLREREREREVGGGGGGVILPDSKQKLASLHRRCAVSLRGELCASLEYRRRIFAPPPPPKKYFRNLVSPIHSELLWT